jgi:hypothetical protein
MPRNRFTKKMSLPNSPAIACVGIDLDHEQIIPLRNANALPICCNVRTGAPVNRVTLHRWASTGAKAADGSTVILQTLKLPSGRVTTVEACERFIRMLTNPASGMLPTPKRRQREIENTELELAELGLI